MIVTGILFCSIFLSCGECNVISLYFLYFSVTGSVCLVCCVSDSSIRTILGVVVILLLNVMEVLGGCALLDRPCMVFQRYVCCACDSSVCVFKEDLLKRYT